MLKLESGGGAYPSDLVIPMKAGLLSAPIIPDTGHWKSTRTRVIPDIFYRESIPTHVIPDIGNRESILVS